MKYVQTSVSGMSVLSACVLRLHVVQFELRKTIDVRINTHTYIHNHTHVRSLSLRCGQPERLCGYGEIEDSVRANVLCVLVFSIVLRIQFVNVIGAKWTCSNGKLCVGSWSQR